MNGFSFRPLLSITWIPVAITFTNHVYSPYFLTGSSMAPTFNPGTETQTNDIVLVKQYGLKRPDSFQKGDIIMLRCPQDPEKIITKRIVGVQGDTINCRKNYPKPTALIPRNHFWVEGDNEFHSMDSNNFGPVSQALIIGKVVSIIWPLNRIGVDITKGGRNAIMINN